MAAEEVIMSPARPELTKPSEPEKDFNYAEQRINFASTFGEYFYAGKGLPCFTQHWIQISKTF